MENVKLKVTLPTGVVPHDVVLGGTLDSAVGNELYASVPDILLSSPNHTLYFTVKAQCDLVTDLMDPTYLLINTYTLEYDLSSGGSGCDEYDTELGDFNAGVFVPVVNIRAVTPNPGIICYW